MSSIKLDIEIELLIEKLRELGLYIKDLENGKVYPNDLWYSWGYKDEDMLSHNFINFVHPEDRDRVQHALDHLDDSDDSFNKVLFRIRTSKGNWRWIYSASISVIRGSDKKIRTYVGFDYDITEEMEAKERAERLAREAETLQSAAAIMNAQLDTQHTISAILQQAKLVFPFDSASVQLLNEETLEIVGGTGFSDDLHVIGLKFPIPGDNPNTEVIRTREVQIINRDIIDHYPRFADLTHKKVRSWMGLPLMSRDELIGMITFDRITDEDFTEDDQRLAKSFSNHVAIALRNAMLYEGTRNLSIKDVLTGAFTRRWMYQLLEQQMELSIRHSHEMSLIMFDIDDFKQVNDSYGHLFGDKVLKTVCDLTRDVLRKTDSLCRYGGEEFAVLLPYTDECSASDVAERIRMSMTHHHWFPDKSQPITLSLGTTSMQLSDLKHQESFFSRADNALLHSKRHGKNRNTSYSTMHLG